MKSFAEKIKAIVSGNHNALMASVPLDFVKSKKGMLREFVLSKESGNAIGIYSKAMGEGMFLTVVERIESSGVIAFSRYDMSGAILTRYELTLDEIQMICRINQRYRHPILRGSERPKVRAIIA